MPGEDPYSLDSIAQLVGAASSILNDIFSIFGGGSDCPAKLQAAQLVAARLQGQLRLTQRELAATQQGLNYARTEFQTTVNESNYRQREFTACTQELAAAQADQRASVQLISQLRSTLTAVQRNAAGCAASQQQLAGQIVQLRSQIAEQSLRIEQDNRTILELRAQIHPCPPCDCGPEVARQTAPLIQEITRLENELRLLMSSRQQLAAQLETLNSQNTQLRNRIAQLTSQLTTCQDRLRTCQSQNGDVQQCRNQLLLCQQQQNVSRETIKQLQAQHEIDTRTIVEIRTQWGQCVSRINLINRQLTVCNQQRQKECPPITCSTLKSLVGTCPVS